jgi:hypothetical protein
MALSFEPSRNSDRSDTDEMLFAPGAFKEEIKFECVMV